MGGAASLDRARSPACAWGAWGEGPKLGPLGPGVVVTEGPTGTLQPSCSGLASTCVHPFSFLPWRSTRRNAEVPCCLAFWRGPPTSWGTPLQKAHSPLPSASKMDSRCRSCGFPVIIPHALQPCLLLTGCQAAAWPAVAVAELDKAPASPAREPPQAPQVAGRPPAPQAQAALCLAWGRGAAPGPRSFLASAKPSRLPAHCAHCLRCSAPRACADVELPLGGRPRPGPCVCRKEWA